MHLVRRTRLLVTLVLLALLALLVASLTAVAPSQAEPEVARPVPAAATSAPLGGAVKLPAKDSFYRYHGKKPLREIKRGTVVAKRSVMLSIGTVTPALVPATQLLYRTQNQLRQPTVTVTTVANPLGVSTGIVAYLSFYDALGGKCSPSYTLRGGNPGADNQQLATTESGLVASLVAQGYAVTVPDFEGTRLHWVAGQESGWNTLDGIRATERFLGAKKSTPVGLFGYSGGSIAGEWAAELAPGYAPELNLVGAALGGLPVHLAHNLKYVNGSDDWSGVIPAVLVALGRAFDLPVAKFESAYGRKVSRQVAHQCIGSFNGNYPGLTVQKLLKKKYRHFLQIPEFARVINKLIMGTTKGHPELPMFLGVGNEDGTGDHVMIVKDVEALAHQYCGQGVTVQFTTYPGSEHTAAGIQFFPAAEAFLAQRIAGVPFAGNCADIGKGNSLAPLKVRH